MFRYVLYYLLCTLSLDFDQGAGTEVKKQCTSLSLSLSLSRLMAIINTQTAGQAVSTQSFVAAMAFPSETTSARNVCGCPWNLFTELVLPALLKVL